MKNDRFDDRLLQHDLALRRRVKLPALPTNAEHEDIHPRHACVVFPSRMHCQGRRKLFIVEIMRHDAHVVSPTIDLPHVHGQSNDGYRDKFVANQDKLSSVRAPRA